MTKQKEQTNHSQDSKSESNLETGRRDVKGALPSPDANNPTSKDFLKDKTFQYMIRGKFYPRKYVYLEDVLKAIKLKEQEVRVDERKRQYEGICTNCGKPDKFSKSTLCSDCINKWKVKLEQQAKQDILRQVKEKIKQIPNCPDCNQCIPRIRVELSLKEIK